MARGRVDVCKWVRLAIERHQRDLTRQGTKAFPYVFDPAKAERIITAAELLPHIKGPKAVVIGVDDRGRKQWATIKVEPWLCWVLTTIFGWVHKKTGARRFRKALIMVPRKNAKSTIAAIVGLYMLACDRESGAEVYSAATTRQQARIVFKTAWRMALRSPAFCEEFNVDISRKDVIEVPDMAAEFLPLSADASTLDGLNPHLAIVDELHAHRTRHVWDVLETALGARSQPLLLPISTAGFNLGGVCYELLTFGQRVLEGVAKDETFFCVNYTIDDGDDWRDEATHRKANPQYGVSVDAETLRAEATKAEHSPGALNNFLTKRLNVWANRDTAWASLPAWQACARPEMKMADYAGRDAWIGVDMGARRDLTALVAWVPEEDGSARVFGRYYLPANTVDKSDIAQLSGWVHAGRVIATPGDTTDYERVEDDLVEWCRLFSVREIVADPALFQRVGPSLERRLGGDPAVIEQPQTAKWQAQWLSQLDEAIRAGRLRHDGDPVLTWMVSNVVGRTLYLNGKEAIVPRKGGGKDSSQHIDGVLAMMLAMSRAEVDGQDGGTVYQDRGVLTL